MLCLIWLIAAHHFWTVLLPMHSERWPGHPEVDMPGAYEHRWFHAHEAEMVARYAGCWIALSGDTVLGVAHDARGAAEQAKARRVKDIALISVPNYVGEWDNLIAGIPTGTHHRVDFEATTTTDADVPITLSGNGSGG